MNKLFSLVFAMISGTAMAAATVDIFPSGDLTGATDQANIQAALDAAGADDNAKIKLAAGIFYVNGGVGVTGFRGTLKGAGPDATSVVALGVGNPINRGSVFLFVDGHPTVKDLSIDVPDGSSYLDSSPFLFVSDGGAAIDVFGGSASIKNVEIRSNGPFIPFGDESLETGVLLHNCDGVFELKDTIFKGVKRSFIFNPEAPSQCDLTLSGNTFDNNRGGIFLFGGEFGFKGGNSGEAVIADNSFDDTLVLDIFGIFVEYPVRVSGNELRHPNPGGNAAIDFTSGSGSLSITDNETDGRYFSPNINLFDHFGGSVISGNKINGASFAGLGAIAVQFSDQVVIMDNDLTGNPFIPGWTAPDFLDGAYALIESTNVKVRNEKLPAASQATCQVLHVPAIDPSNEIDPNLIECATGF